MNCKFCNAELPEDVTLCPACGEENAQEIAEILTSAETAEEAIEETAEETAEETIEETAEETVEETADETTEETAEEEPAKAKPKAWLMVLAIIGAVAVLVVLVGAVLFGTGAFDKTESYTVSDEKAVKARDTVVATVGDETLTNSALQVYYWQSVSDFYNTYGNYLDTSVLDMSKPLDEQIYDEETGTTWQQFFLEGALNTWSRYAALCMAAKEEGVTLTADVQAYLDGLHTELESTAATYGYDSVEAMLAEDMSVVCDEAGYMAYVTTNLVAGQYLDGKYEQMIPSMEEIENYYTENEAALNEQGIAKDGSVTTDVRHILICPKGGTADESGNTVYSDAEWETCRKQAQDILDQWAAQGGTEESFAQLAVEHTEDPGSMSTGGLYTDIYKGQMVEPFENWCFDASRKPGDTGLVQTVCGYHIMYFVESSELWIDKVQDNIVYERSLEMVNNAVEKWPLDVKYNKIVVGQTNTEAE